MLKQNLYFKSSSNRTIRKNDAFRNAYKYGSNAPVCI